MRERSGAPNLSVSDLDHRNEIQLTDNKAQNIWPSWSSDGKRIVFLSNRTGKFQVWIVDADGKNQTQLTDHPDGVAQPAVSPTSDVIAYREEHAANEKLPPSTLRTVDFSGRNSKVVVEKTQMLGHAWSPKGDQLAVSLVQELRILHMPAASTVKSFTFQDVHKDLYAHAAYGMTWRPDGKAIACTIQFLGGRRGNTEILGDKQIFILPFEGKPVTIETGAPAEPVRWIR